MREQRSGVRRMAEMLVKTCANKLMIGFDNNGAGKKFPQRVDRN